MKRANINKRAPEAAAPESVDSLNQEIKALKKDLSTYERMAKQAEENNKTKDGQIKRAMDTIARLKLQLQEAQTQVQVIL
jgi:predicted  nucleic acid-binding Zn-ribbon protein